MGDEDPRDGEKKTPVTAIILNHNTRDLLEDCLSSLAENDPEGALETIVVDNNSTDGSVEMVRTRFPHVRIIALNANQGFSAGMNAGIRSSAGDFLLLLNADTFLPPGSVNRLLSAIRHLPQVGIAGPRLVDAEGDLQDSCQFFPTITLLHCWRFLLRLLGMGTGISRMACKKGRPLVVDWLHGACLLVRREMLEEVGLFDPGYFLYGEDMDLCFRARRHGWCVAYIPEVEVVHFGNRSATQLLGKEGSYFQIRLRAIALNYFLRRHFGKGHAILVCSLLSAGALATSVALAPSWFLPLPTMRPLRTRCLIDLKLAVASLSALVNGLRREGPPDLGKIGKSGAFPPSLTGSIKEPHDVFLPRLEEKSAKQEREKTETPGPCARNDRLLIIPAHDEEIAIRKVVEEAKEYAGVDVMVIDDGSRDCTREYALSAGAECLYLPQNSGVGNAERKAFQLALTNGYLCVARIDGDGQHDPYFLPHLLQALQEHGADLVIGSRYRYGYWTAGRFIRPLGTLVFSRLVAHALRVQVTDVTCGMRAYSRRAMRILMQYQPDRFPEIAALLLAGRFGLRIAEVPVMVRERAGGASHLKPLVIMRYFLANLGRILNYRWGRYPRGMPILSEEAVDHPPRPAGNQGFWNESDGDEKA
ncbi:MAG: glycosyltransferase [Actinomycetota bacterium]